MTRPSARPSRVTSSAWLIADQQLDGLAHRVVAGHRGERGLHDVDDLGLEQRRVLGRMAQQTALADRADDGDGVMRADDRELRDAVLVQQGHRVADAGSAARP